MAGNYDGSTFDDLDPNLPRDTDSLGTAAPALRQIKRVLNGDMGLKKYIKEVLEEFAKDPNDNFWDIIEGARYGINRKPYFSFDPTDDPAVRFGGRWKKFEEYFLKGSSVNHAASTFGSLTTGIGALVRIETGNMTTTGGIVCPYTAFIYSDQRVFLQGRLPSYVRNGSYLIPFPYTIISAIGFSATADSASSGTDTDTGGVGIEYMNDQNIRIRTARASSSGGNPPTAVYFNCHVRTNVDVSGSTEAGGESEKVVYLGIWCKVEEPDNG